MIKVFDLTFKDGHQKYHRYFDSRREMGSFIAEMEETLISVKETEIPTRISFPVIINGKEMMCRLDDYNQEWNIRLSGNDEPEGKLNYKTIAETKGNILVWCKDSLGFVHFGAIGKQAHYDQEAGYMWSSRASVFNGLGCEHCMEGSYNHGVVGIPIDWVKSIVDGLRENGIDIRIFKTIDDGEIKYTLISVDRNWHCSERR